MENAILELDDKLQELSTDYVNLSNNIVESYTADLDDMIKNIHTDIYENNISDDMLENYSLKLASTLYFISVRLEEAGVLEDLSKMMKQEAYNDSYLTAQSEATEKGSKLTAPQTQAIAEEKSKYNSMLNSIYDHVYKSVKLKIDAAYELLSTIKKIISKRMTEYQLEFSEKAPSTRKLLLEDI